MNEDKDEASTSNGGPKAPNCLFKRMKRGGGGNASGSSNRRRPMPKSSSESSENSDQNSDTEVYKKPKKSRSGLVQSTTFKINPDKKKRRWKKHLDGQNTSDDTGDSDEGRAPSDFGVKFQGSGAQSSGPSDQGATATLEIDTSHDLVNMLLHNLNILNYPFPPKLTFSMETFLGQCY